MRINKNIKEHKEEMKKSLIEIFKSLDGNISASCRKIGIARRTFYNWKKEDPRFAKDAEEVLSEIKEDMDDFAEQTLFDHIRNGNIASLLFYLKMRHPNYKLRMKIEGKIKSEVSLSEEDKELLIKALRYGGMEGNSNEDN